MRGFLRFITPLLLFIGVGIGIMDLAPSSSAVVRPNAESNPFSQESVRAAEARVERTGCAPRSPGASVPLGIGRVGGTSIALVGTCVDGHGPFPFVVDTGSSVSVIARSLARQINLAQSAAELPVATVGCSVKVGLASLHRLSLSGLVVAPQTVLVAAMGNLSGVDGLIGSDLLSRQGSATIDYTGASLSLGAHGVGASIDINVVRQALPGALAGQSAVVAIAHVGFGRMSLPLVVDSGAARLTLRSAVASSLGLRSQGSTLLQGIGCSIRAQEYRVNHWSIGGRAMDAIAANGAELPDVAEAKGLLGSNVLAAHGEFTIDYRNQRLYLDDPKAR